MRAEDVLDFWFGQHGIEDWFGGDPGFDDKCKTHLSDVHARAVRGELWQWRATPEGRVAEIVLLDQISRQLHRGEAGAFASDTMALALAQELVYGHAFDALPRDRQLFALMPFQHAESLAVQEESVRLFRQFDDAELRQYAEGHHETILRFGRFPFRNKALGRISTPDEIGYMEGREGQVF